MKFILTPIDFSEGTPRVVEEAAKLAVTIEAHIILIHIVQVPKSLSAVAEFGGRAKLIAAMELEAERRLLEIKADLLQRRVTAHSLRLTGNPVSDIADQAKKLDAICIVMGSHGHSALHDLVIGSTVSGVLKRAGCPVIVVPLGKRQKGNASTSPERRLTAV